MSSNSDIWVGNRSCIEVTASRKESKDSPTFCFRLRISSRISKDVLKSLYWNLMASQKSSHTTGLAFFRYLQYHSRALPDNNMFKFLQRSEKSLLKLSSVKVRTRYKNSSTVNPVGDPSNFRCQFCIMVVTLSG